jgi:hypothetical protein
MWFNHRRLYEYCGDVPPAQMEAAYYAQQPTPTPVEVSNWKVSGHAGAVHYPLPTAHKTHGGLRRGGSRRNRATRVPPVLAQARSAMLPRW